MFGLALYFSMMTLKEGRAIMMKKLIALIISLICVFTLSCCTDNTDKEYKLPQDQFCYSIENSQTVELKTKDKKYIIDLLNEASWVNDAHNCGYNFFFYTQEQELTYQSTCGAFYDITNRKSTFVSEEQRVAINAILGEN